MRPSLVCLVSTQNSEVLERHGGSRLVIEHLRCVEQHLTTLLQQHRVSFPVINHARSYFAEVNVRVRRAFRKYAIRDMYLGARVSLFDRTRNDKCTCVRAPYVHIPRMYVPSGGLMQAIETATSQPTNLPTTNQLYYYAVAPYNSREPELNVRKARRHYRANKGFL